MSKIKCVLFGHWSNAVIYTDKIVQKCGWCGKFIMEEKINRPAQPRKDK